MGSDAVTGPRRLWLRFNRGPVFRAFNGDRVHRCLFDNDHDHLSLEQKVLLRSSLHYYTHVNSALSHVLSKS
jgi:hypothetical protein